MITTTEIIFVYWLYTFDQMYQNMVLLILKRKLSCETQECCYIITFRCKNRRASNTEIYNVKNYYLANTFKYIRLYNK